MGHVADLGRRPEADTAPLLAVQFLEVPGKAERLAVIPESVYRVLEEIVRSRQLERQAKSAADLPSDVQRELQLGMAPVRVIRKWRNLSGAKLARMVGITPSMLSQLELHGKAGSIETYAKLSNILNVPIDLLLAQKDSQR
ncbi:helix-turn-helix transcriptional regulator [Pararhizobium sp. LjRoot235]|uniref:helix-turn-helix domain-containing protein n=1 Tax=Pararhizobium sp. LjRoot235 TaxID=3342291 RepID=UPI003ECDFB2B